MAWLAMPAVLKATSAILKVNLLLATFGTPRAFMDEMSMADLAGLSSKSGLFCNKFEVCKCVASWDEASTVCKAQSCTFAPGAPRICCAKGGFFCNDPDCPDYKSWEDCEWANFAGEEGYELPGQDLYVEVPLGHSALSSGEGLLVMSDVDDTMKCSGGPPAGADSECLGTVKGGMYPGMAEFMLALSRGAADERQPRSVIPLSARPKALKLLLGMKASDPMSVAFAAAARALGVEGWGLDTESAMYGALSDTTDFKELAGIRDTDLTRYDKLGYRKYENWKRKATDLGMPGAFVGDNGQGDVVAAQMMLKRSEGLTDQQGAVRVAFIHDVLKRCRSPHCRDGWAKHGIYFFRDYAQAAGLAAQHQLLSAASCAAVCAAAPTLDCTCP